MEIRVTIFEDNKLVRDALQIIVDGSPGYTCTGAFADASNWQAAMQRGRPDVVLMDIEMPGLNGIDVTRQLQLQFPDTKVLIQTVFNDSDKIFNALCAGASGYLLKNDPPHKYLEAINEVYHGGAPMNSTVAKKVLGFFGSKNVILVSPGNNDFLLSKRETEILQLMMSGENYRSIAEKAFISYGTVRTHIKSIYKKLHVASRSEALQKALQKGLV